MPRVKTTPPTPDRAKGQRSLDLPLYLNRIIPYWGNPDWMKAESWRQVVLRQPIAMACRETLIANIIALDWKIEPRDSQKRDEHKNEIDYYTNFFEDTGAYDFVEIIEWVGADLLDIPFGAGIELIRQGDNPDGKLLDIVLLDGATLFPTLNSDYPVGQKLEQNPTKQVYFPWYAINRVLYSPRRDIRREGWGMPPPEKVYLAIELLNRGDVYYANLLLDSPEVGILDLGDMAKDSAEEWVKAWRDMLFGTDPFKIPILYEHESTVNWIPFTRSPVELMYDKAITKYASIVTSGYGMSLSDIGVSVASSGGDTLAGTIRQERQTRRTGKARMKKKIELFFNRMLPKYLEFKFVDLDDELNVALGRARLATSTAWQQLVNSRMFTPGEGRQQMIADGLITISIPEKLPDGAFDDLMEGNGGAERPSMLGRPVSPSEGGWGEVAPKSDAIIKSLHEAKNVDRLILERIGYHIFPIVRAEIEEVLSQDIIRNRLDAENWLEWHEEFLNDNLDVQIPEFSLATMDYAIDALVSSVKTDFIVVDEDQAIQDIVEAMSDTINDLIIDGIRKSYIRGEIDSVEEERFENNKILEEKAKPLLDDFITRSNDKIRKSIVYAVYKYSITHPEVADVLDIELNGDMILLMWEEIHKTCDKILSDLGLEISDIIKEVLEKEYKNETTKDRRGKN